MKKLLLLLLFTLGVAVAQADDYTYLTFETTDGSRVSVEAQQLSLTLTGTTLKAGEQTFTLTNLSKMYFSSSDETSGIDALRADMSQVSAVYDLQGRRVTEQQMRSGQVYIVKTASGTHKIAVR